MASRQPPREMCSASVGETNRLALMPPLTCQLKLTSPPGAPVAGFSRDPGRRSGQPRRDDTGTMLLQRPSNSHNNLPVDLYGPPLRRSLQQEHGIIHVERLEAG